MLPMMSYLECSFLGCRNVPRIIVHRYNSTCPDEELLAQRIEARSLPISHRRRLSFTPSFNPQIVTAGPTCRTKSQTLRIQQQTRQTQSLSWDSIKSKFISLELAIRLKTIPSTQQVHLGSEKSRFKSLGVQGHNLSPQILET